MGINKPVLKIEYTDNPSAEVLAERDLYIKRNLKQVAIKDEAGQTNDVLSLTFVDDGSLGIPPYKSTISVSIGYVNPDNNEKFIYNLGNFSVNKVKKTKSTSEKLVNIDCVTISSIDNMRTVRTRNFNGQTLTDVGATIATESSLNFKIHPDLANEIVERSQTKQSNQAFLRQECEMHYAFFKVIKDTLYIMPRGPEVNVAGNEVEVIEVSADNYMFNYEYVLDQAKNVTGVRALYKTGNGEETLSVLAGDNSGEVRVLAQTYNSQTVAQQRANAFLRTASSNEETLNFTGDASLPITADRRILVKATDKDLNNKTFKVTSVTFTFIKGILTASYNCESA